ncbi:MAG: 2OG-Fe(II) oxygenase [Vampirovibrionales bacterium]
MIGQLNSEIANVTMLPVEYGEGLQVLRYEVGQEYKPHFDYFDPTLSGSKQPLDEGGQRVATMLMYLSAPEEGGETTFPDIGLSVAPVKGNAILFWSVLPNLQVDPLSKHRVRSPLKVAKDHDQMDSPRSLGTQSPLLGSR